MKKTIKGISALLLALILAAGCFTGCASLGKTMMELDDGDVSVEMSVNLFQLYLSRMKGTLASSYGYGSKALTDSFWDTWMTSDGTTYNDYYTAQVLENAKTYLAALYEFEKQELELPESYVEEIDAALEALIESDADGSKSKFNALLAEYGVNYKILREANLRSAKIEYLRDVLFGVNGSKIGEELIQSYYEQNYRRFKQVFLYTYGYSYVQDSDGAEIYYRTDDPTKISYDTSATPKKDGSGNPVSDANGDQVYVTEDGKIAYDKKNGERRVRRDENGKEIMEQYTGDKLQEVKDQIAQLEAKVTKGDFNGFDALVAQYNLDSGLEKYTDGYYMMEITDYDAPEVVQKLFELQVGESATVESDYGIHLMMRYELEVNDNQADYKKELNADMFISLTTGTYVFMSDLEDRLFADYLEKYRSMIVVDEAILAEADIKRIGANFYY